MPVLELEISETTQVTPKRKRMLPVQVYLYLLWFLSFRAIGNVSMAWGVRHLGKGLAINPVAYIEAIFDPVVGIGVLFLVGAILARLVLLSLADLSFVVPMTAAGYVISAITGKLLLHETVSLERWLGVALIFIATLLVGSTAKNTRRRDEEVRVANDAPERGSV
jgi:hypothetical protein